MLPPFLVTVDLTLPALHHTGTSIALQFQSFLYIARVSVLIQTYLLISSKPATLSEYSSYLAMCRLHLLIHGAPESSHHMLWCLENPIPFWYDQRARGALMRPLCCRHRSCRHSQFSLGMLWDPKQCCQEVDGFAEPTPSPNSAASAVSPLLVCFTASELPLSK